MSYPGYPPPQYPIEPGQGPANNPHTGGYAAYPATNAYPENSYNRGYPPQTEPNLLVQGSGRINPIAAVKYAGQRWAANTNWLTWALMTLLGFIPFVVVYFVFLLALFTAAIHVDDLGNYSSEAERQRWSIGVLVVSAVLLVASGVLSFVAACWTYRGAVMQPEHPKIQFRHFFKDARIISQFLVLLLGIVVVAAGGLLLAWSSDDIFFGPNGQFYFYGPDPTEALRIFSLIALISLLLAPFFLLLPFFVADGHGSWGSIKASVKAGAQNWPKLFLFSLAEGIVVLAANLISAGLAIFIIAPLALITRGHMTRQASGGLIPVETHS